MVKKLFREPKNGTSGVVVWEMVDLNERFERWLKDLRNENPDCRETAAWYLGKFRERRAVKALIQALKEDDDIYVRRTAAQALGWIGDKRAVGPLIQTLKEDEDSDVRRLSAEALEQIKDGRAVEPLVQSLKEDRNMYVRLSAAKALDVLGWVPENNVEKAYYLVAKHEWDDVVRMGGVAAVPLFNAILDEEPALHSEARGAFRALGDEGVKRLIRALNDGDKDVRCKAALVIGRTHMRSGVEALIGALRDEDWEVRVNAAWALGVLKDKRAVEPLIRARNDAEEREDWDLLVEAEKALEYILS